MRTLLFLVLVCGCESSNSVCVEATPVAVETLTIGPSTTVASATVIGTLTRESDVAVTQVVVAGIASTSVVGDFDQFSATVPVSGLNVPGIANETFPKVNVVTDCGSDKNLSDLVPSKVTVTLGPIFTPTALTIEPNSSVTIDVTFLAYPSDQSHRACTSAGDSKLSMKMIDDPTKATGPVAIEIDDVAAPKGAMLQVVCTDEYNNQTTLLVTADGS